MSEAYIGEIRMFSFGFPPRNWALCNGQIMSISQNQALFALLGTTYGGNGVSTFALPNLQGRVPMHRSAVYPQGVQAGEENHTLTTPEIPSHTHGVIGSSEAPNQASPAGAFWPTGGALTPYAAAGDGSMLSPPAVGYTGGQPHENRPPFEVVSFAIALAGIFPPRN